MALAEALGGNLNNFDRRRLTDGWDGSTPYDLLLDINETLAAIEMGSLCGELEGRSPTTSELGSLINDIGEEIQTKFTNEIRSSRNGIEEFLTDQELDLSLMVNVLTNSTGGLPGIIQLLVTNQNDLRVVKDKLFNATQSSRQTVELVNHSEYGLKALDRSISTVDSRLVDSMDGLPALKNLLVVDGKSGMECIKDAIADAGTGLPAILTFLGHSGYGLEALSHALGSHADGSPSVLDLLKNESFGLESIKRALDTSLHSCR